MSKQEERAEAEKLYIKGASITEISERLDIPAQTLYRWRKEAADNGEETDWDNAKELWNMSPAAMTRIYLESIKHWIIELKKNPEKLADPKVADSMTKHIAAIKKLDPGYSYLGAILDLIKVTNQYLNEHDPQLAKKMLKVWPKVKEILEDYATTDGIIV